MALTLWPFLFFDPERDSERERRVVRGRAPATRREQRLYCANCRHAITTQEQRIHVNGAQEHHCTNPHGITFDIACFRDAPGCNAMDPATAEHTWFPGYAWRIAHCRRCDLHLGWLFTSSADGFYGLIVDRLTSEERS